MSERKISILHIASDEKFINAANYIFEKAFPGCNRFIIPLSRFNRKLRYVSLTNNIEIFSYRNGLVKSLSEMIRKYDCVVMHGITEFNSTVFLSAQDKSRFVGFLWGAELYTEENFPERNLKGELTSAIRLQKPDYSTTEKLKNFFRKIVYRNSVIQQNASKKAAYELPYFGVPYKEEFDLFREKKLISEKCRLIPFTYYPLEFIMKGNESSIINGNDILIGNSASFTSNHLEAFQLLESINIGNRNVVVPLSYGDPLYADYISEAGTSVFNSRFKALRRFMSLPEYTKEILGCGIVIMNHYRQQAVGNILTMLWLGSKVYLSELNSFFHYLKRIGIHIFSIEKELKKENQIALRNLSGSEIEHNRAILKKAISEENIIFNLKQALLQYF